MQAAILTHDAIVHRLSWPDAVEALRDGLKRAAPQIGDLFLGPPDGTLLTRAAYLPGVGYGVKSVTVRPDNPQAGRPSVQGAMLVFDEATGALTAIVESRLVTEFKTAADSVLGARLLARKDARHLVIVGAGSVARSLVQAYGSALPGLERISIWARRFDAAQELARKGGPVGVSAVDDLRTALRDADIVSTTTMAIDPVLPGDWIRPGTHVDLIGAFRPDMREADDALIAKGGLFVDCRETTIDHIGELMRPIAAGVISATDIRGDLPDLIEGRAGRTSDTEITIFKNGGGAHLDLLIARYIAQASRSSGTAEV